MFYTIVGYNTHIKRKHQQLNNHQPPKFESNPDHHHQHQPKFGNELDQHQQQHHQQNKEQQCQPLQATGTSFEQKQFPQQQQEKHNENREQCRQQQLKIEKEFKQQEKQQFREIERQHHQQQIEEKQLMSKARPPKKKSPLSKTENGIIKHENEALTFSAETCQVQGPLSCQELTFGDTLRLWEHSDLLVQLAEEEAANRNREMLKSKEFERSLSCINDDDQVSFIQMDTAPSETGIPESFNKTDLEQRVQTDNGGNQVSLTSQAPTNESSSNEIFQNNRAKKFQCETCEKSFRYRSAFDRHNDAVHKKIKSSHCSVCQKRFSQRSHLIKHIKTVHEKIKPVQSSVCQKSFGRKQYLVRHLKTVHEKIRPF
jgi:hypothetical protein